MCTFLIFFLIFKIKKETRCIYATLQDAQYEF